MCFIYLSILIPRHASPLRLLRQTQTVVTVSSSASADTAAGTSTRGSRHTGEVGAAPPHTPPPALTPMPEKGRGNCFLLLFLSFCFGFCFFFFFCLFKIVIVFYYRILCSLFISYLSIYFYVVIVILSLSVYISRNTS